MDFAEVIRKRRMVRNFMPEPVAPEVVDRMLEQARRVPSAGYSQGQAFIVVTEPELRREVGRICDVERAYEQMFGRNWVAEAPVQIVACVDEATYHARYQESDKLRADGTEIPWPIPYWYIDIGFSVMVLLLAAVNEGLAAAYADIKDVEALRDLLAIPLHVTPVGVIPIGHPAPDIPSPSAKRGRKPLESVVHRERW